MQKTKELTYLEIIKFYLPLALAAMIMISSVNVVNSALSKIKDAEIAIAAFAIAFSYAQMLSSPCFSGMNMLITLGPDKEYYLNTVKFMLKVAFICLLAVSALAFTPLGDFVALRLGGATKQLLPGIRSVWRWSLLMPLIFFSIATTRAVLIIERSTYFVTISRFLRLLVMLILAYFLPKISMLQGAAIGAIIMLGGQASEAFFAAWPAWHYFKKWGKKSLEDIPKKIYPPTQRAAWHFIAPLILTSLMWGVIRPLLYAGLARLEQPELTIATYKVATNFVWLFMVFIQDTIKQTTVAFYRKTKESKDKIIRFSIIVSLVITAIILILALTPLGYQALYHIVGVNADIARLSVAPMLILAIYPIIQTIQEHFQARLLIQGKTISLGIAKVVNIVAMAIAIFTLATTVPQLGASAGAIALSFGMLAEMLSMRFFALRQRA